METKFFNLEQVRFKGHDLKIDGNVKNGRIHFYHVYLFNTDIEISDSLTSSQHDELVDFISNLI